MEAAVIYEVADRLVGLAADHDHRIELALLQLFHADALLDIGELAGVEPDALEHCECGDEGAAVRKVDADALAVQIVQVADIQRRDDLHFLVVQLGHIGELLAQAVRDALALEIVERIGAHDSDVYALQEQDVGDALYRTATDDGENAQPVAIVEHG